MCSLAYKVQILLLILGFNSNHILLISCVKNYLLVRFKLPKVPPILLPFEFGEEPSDIHSTTTVSCAVAKGDTPIEINWMFNGSKIFSNDGITITKSGQKMILLYIESVQARHAGNYTCVARNKAGFVEHTSELKVIGRSEDLSNIIVCKPLLCYLCLYFQRKKPPCLLNVVLLLLWFRKSRQS